MSTTQSQDNFDPYTQIKYISTNHTTPEVISSWHWSQVKFRPHTEIKWISTTYTKNKSFRHPNKININTETKSISTPTQKPSQSIPTLKTSHFRPAHNPSQFWPPNQNKSIDLHNKTKSIWIPHTNAKLLLTRTNTDAASFSMPTLKISHLSCPRHKNQVKFDHQVIFDPYTKPSQFRSIHWKSIMILHTEIKSISTTHTTPKSISTSTLKPIHFRLVLFCVLHICAPLPVIQQ